MKKLLVQASTKEYVITQLDGRNAPRTGIIKRYHVHESNTQRAVNSPLDS